MTKEELEKEADKWLVDNLHSTEEDYKRAYLAGAEPREKRISELEAQIKKMKCCGNCVWSDCDGKLGNPPCKYCDFNNKWELRR